MGVFASRLPRLLNLDQIRDPREALDRIGKLYDIERDINGQPKVAAFHALPEQQFLRIPGKSELAKAFRYGLARQKAFSLFPSEGRVAIDNNPSERARTIIETAKLNSLDPQAKPADIFEHIHDHKFNQLDELLRWNWSPVHQSRTVKPHKPQYHRAVTINYRRLQRQINAMKLR